LVACFRKEEVRDMYLADSVESATEGGEDQ
jgi:hypothetical protein